MSRCTRLVAASAGLATVVASLALTAPAQASRTVSETYSVPANGTLRLTGHGYGHGHGMSQYGAQGAALKGLTHQQILAFYYPGTTLSTTTGPIRVLVSADTDSDVRVLPASGLKVRDASSGAAYTLPATAGVKTWRLRTTVSGATVLDYEKSGWHVHKPGVSLTGEAEFFRAGTLTLRVGGGTRTYRGAMRLAAKDTVNVLSLDEYVQGVVPREMPVSWKPAAVQAQAVAARTYAAFDRAAHASRHYDTCDTTSCQVYGGVSDEDPRGNAAVAATASRVLTHGGKPAFTQFASSSGGWLLAGSRPYLVSKADPYDNFSGNPMHTWNTTVTRAAIQRAWPSLGTLKRVLVTKRDGNGDWHGRVEQMRLDGSRSDVTVSGSAFRSALGLRSSWFRFGNATTTSPPAPAPAPAPAPDPGASPTTTSKASSPIYKRWKRIGGADSVVGMPRAREYAVAGGLARRFAHGRIFYKDGAGPHELHGKVLRAYVKRGGATSRLGFPRTKPLRSGRGWFARFEHGVISVRGNGKVRVTYTS